MLLLLNMNPAFERVLRDIHRIRLAQKENKDKDIKTPSIKSIKKNESIENFMKFQWTWTM